MNSRTSVFMDPGLREDDEERWTPSSRDFVPLLRFNRLRRWGVKASAAPSAALGAPSAGCWMADGTRFDTHVTAERFQLLINDVTDYAIYMLDADGYVATWNPGA